MLRDSDKPTKAKVVARDNGEKNKGKKDSSSLQRSEECSVAPVLNHPWGLQTAPLPQALGSHSKTQF